jgi:hypothetical protein
MHNKTHHSLFRCQTSNYFDCLAFSVNFSNCQFGFHALEIRVLFGRNSTFEHPAYLNSGKNDVEAYIY